MAARMVYPPPESRALPSPGAPSSPNLPSDTDRAQTESKHPSRSLADRAADRRATQTDGGPAWRLTARCRRSTSIAEQEEDGVASSPAQSARIATPHHSMRAAIARRDPSRPRHSLAQ